MAFEVGQIVKGSLCEFLILREVTRGAMGQLFEAIDTETVDSNCPRRLVIITPEADAESRERFFRQAQLFHIRKQRGDGLAHVLETCDYACSSQPFMVVEYLNGCTLQEVIALGPPPPEEALSLIGQVLHGLAAVHHAGVLHRDLRPANIFLTVKDAGWHATIIDFGSAVREGQGRRDPSSRWQPYVAPEQHWGNARRTSDLYSVGVILWELVMGRPPKKASDLTRVDRLDIDLQRLLLRATAQDERQRFRTADEFRIELETYLQRKRSQRKTPTSKMGPWPRPERKHFAFAFAAIVVFASRSLADHQRPERALGATPWRQHPGAAFPCDECGEDWRLDDPR